MNDTAVMAQGCAPGPQPQMSISEVLNNISGEIATVENKLRTTLNRVNTQPESPKVADMGAEPSCMITHVCMIRDTVNRCSILMSELENSL